MTFFKPLTAAVTSDAAAIAGMPPASAPPGIRVVDLALRFDQNTIFEHLTFDIAGGEFIALLGASGVGKSSLLKIIAGLAQPSSGSVIGTDGKPVPGRIAYMGQQDLLFPWLTVLQNVTLGARLRGEKSDDAWAQHLLERVGLAQRQTALPNELSGGMKQRAAIARTLYERQPIVLMDEPFSALDAITRAKVQDLAAELLVDQTVLLITHDPLEACRLGHRMMVLVGHPAKIARIIEVPGLPPRANDNPDVLRTQGEFMRLLMENEA